MRPRSNAAAVFLLGLIVGAAAGSWGQRAHFRRALHEEPNRRRMILERLGRELGLDAKQKDAVSAILDSRKADVDKLKADTFARLEVIRKATDADLAKALTPEQAAKLESMHRRGKPMRLVWEAPAPSAAP